MSRFADGELDEPEHQRVTKHLARCPRCRDEVTLIRRLGDVTRDLATPRVSPAVLDDALARRWAGDRVLLPPSDPGAAQPSSRQFLSPLAALIVFLVATFLVSVGVLWASRPESAHAPPDAPPRAVEPVGTLGSSPAALRLAPAALPDPDDAHHPPPSRLRAS
ncbi:MAG: zf-HC2 domain-containing protein [Gemmatimonadota bacterium]